MAREGWSAGSRMSVRGVRWQAGGAQERMPLLGLEPIAVDCTGLL
ncbi:hypothetical protein [Nonomuraea dietziae]